MCYAQFTTHLHFATLGKKTMRFLKGTCHLHFALQVRNSERKR